MRPPRASATRAASPLRQRCARGRAGRDAGLGAGALPHRRPRPGRFDGTHLYEYADPREGFHNDWNTLIYNFGRTEVRNFLVGSALYWLERYGVDGLRVDAVASMLYRDYSRKPGEWMPNATAGARTSRPSPSSSAPTRSSACERPQAITLAEESTAFPGVSRPTYAGGLGFHYKWNMGWMHDTLKYMARDPMHRRHHQGEMSFGLVYAFSENFVLPLSHDEVVHGKGSLLARCPATAGTVRQPARLLRLHVRPPGQEAAVHGLRVRAGARMEPRPSLDWHLRRPEHAGVQHLVRDLNRG
jgi:1,4-alpha-glucan branching enzyme